MLKRDCSKSMHYPLSSKAADPKSGNDAVCDHSTSIAARRRIGGLRAAILTHSMPGFPPLENAIEISVDDRHDDQRQQRRCDHAADDRASHRRLRLAAFAEAQR